MIVVLIRVGVEGGGLPLLTILRTLFADVLPSERARKCCDCGYKNLSHVAEALMFCAYATVRRARGPQSREEGVVRGF